MRLRNQQTKTGVLNKDLFINFLRSFDSFTNHQKSTSLVFHYLIIPISSFEAVNVVPCEQRLHYRGMSWRAKSSYFSQASSYRENLASARRVSMWNLEKSFQKKTRVLNRSSDKTFTGAQ